MIRRTKNHHCTTTLKVVLPVLAINCTIYNPGVSRCCLTSDQPISLIPITNCTSFRRSILPERSNNSRLAAPPAGVWTWTNSPLVTGLGYSYRLTLSPVNRKPMPVAAVPATDDVWVPQPWRLYATPPKREVVSNKVSEPYWLKVVSLLNEVPLPTVSRRK